MTNNNDITDNDIIESIFCNDESDLRRRINTRRETDRAFDERVTAWEGVLFGLHEHETKHIAPPEQVWTNVEKTLFGTTPSRGFFAHWLPRLALPTVVAVAAFFAVKDMNLPQPSKMMTAQFVAENTLFWDVESDGKVVTFHNTNAVPDFQKMRCMVWAVIDGQTYELGDVPDEGLGRRKSLTLPQQANRLKLIVQGVPMQKTQTSPDYSRDYLARELTRRG